MRTPPAAIHPITHRYVIQSSFHVVAHSSNFSSDGDRARVCARGTLIKVEAGDGPIWINPHVLATIAPSDLASGEPPVVV